ncbi:MAG: Rne/Rng family ribonuclease [Candidatus Omnitrophica bacterium]|nr:Rne/Rng family ribonuclease [Candidatus Omnitrophota bacterium]
MSKEIFINVNSHEKRVAVLQNKRIEEFYVERADTVNLVGNIYKGKVESVLPGIEAAFVNIGLEKNGFLYVTDAVSGMASYEKLLEEEAGEEFGEKPEEHKKLPRINEVVKKGDDVLVQIEKEPISTKGPRLTTHISIPGRFLVLMPFDNHIGLSKRIEDRKERDRIRQIFERLKLPKEIGFIVRTVAQGASEKDFAREANYLLRLWQQIQHKAQKARPPQLIHEEHDLILRITRDLLDDKVARLEVDSKNEFRRIMHFLRIYSPQLRSRVRWYRDRIPVFEKFGVEEQIDKIYNRIINLKSGGYLVFDETESLVAIDVNSGKSVRGKNLEDTAFRTNMEAAAEIPRQLKMRDIGGIIIIDFIDMEVHGHRKAVVAALERALEDDKAKSKILNISRIGLVEMTRQRMRKSVEGKSYQKCPYCNGRGTVKSALTVSIDLMRKLERALFEAPRARELFVSLHPEVAAYVSSPEKNMVKPLEKRFRKTIRIVEDPNQHLEDIKIDIVK